MMNAAFRTVVSIVPVSSFAVLAALLISASYMYEIFRQMCFSSLSSFIFRFLFIAKQIFLFSVRAQQRAVFASEKNFFHTYESQQCYSRRGAVQEEKS